MCLRAETETLDKSVLFFNYGTNQNQKVNKTLACLPPSSASGAHRENPLLPAAGQDQLRPLPPPVSNQLRDTAMDECVKETRI